jgi:hypothetical protein
MAFKGSPLRPSRRASREDISREEAEARMDELLALEHRQLELT